MCNKKLIMINFIWVLNYTEKINKCLLTPQGLVKGWFL